MFGWLRRIFGGQAQKAGAAPPVAAPAPVAEPPPAPVAAPEAAAPAPTPVPAPAPTPTPAPLGVEEIVLLVHIGRAAGRRARPAVLAALREATAGRPPSLAWAPSRAQVTRAANRLARATPARRSALLASAEHLAAAARAPLPPTLRRLARR